MLKFVFLLLMNVRLVLAACSNNELGTPGQTGEIEFFER